jgi:membrane-bound lytic murein transglycosylase D
MRIGQRLVIPISPAAQARGGRAVARSTTVRPGPAPAAAARPASGRHTVKWGESLWTISQRYGVKVGDLREWNDLLEEDVLKAGQRLVVVKPTPAAAAEAATAESSQ